MWADSQCKIILGMTAADATALSRDFGSSVRDAGLMHLDSSSPMMCGGIVMDRRPAADFGGHGTAVSGAILG